MSAKSNHFLQVKTNEPTVRIWSRIIAYTVRQTDTKFMKICLFSKFFNIINIFFWIDSQYTRPPVPYKSPLQIQMLFKSFSKTLFFFVWLFFNFKCYFFNHFIYMLNYNESMVIETLVVCTSQNNYCFWIEILIKKMILQKTLKNCFLYYTIFFSFKANIYYFKIDLFKITNLIFLGLGGGAGVGYLKLN